jgi:hypothetical protein
MMVSILRAAMNILDDLRAEWIAIRKSLGDHIAYLEAGNNSSDRPRP